MLHLFKSTVICYCDCLASVCGLSVVGHSSQESMLIDLLKKSDHIQKDNVHILHLTYWIEFSAKTDVYFCFSSRKSFGH